MWLNAVIVLNSRSQISRMRARCWKQNRRSPHCNPLSARSGHTRGNLANSSLRGEIYSNVHKLCVASLGKCGVCFVNRAAYWPASVCIGCTAWAGSLQCPRFRTSVTGDARRVRCGSLYRARRGGPVDHTQRRSRTIPCCTGSGTGAAAPTPISCASSSETSAASSATTQPIPPGSSTSAAAATAWPDRASAEPTRAGPVDVPFPALNCDASSDHGGAGARTIHRVLDRGRLAAPPQVRLDRLRQDPVAIEFPRSAHGRREGEGCRGVSRRTGGRSRATRSIPAARRHSRASCRPPRRCRT